MGSIANQLTSPLGVKLFSGGPYADRELGSAALAASKPLQQTGQNLLTSGSQALPDLFGQLGATAGVGSPFATGSSKTDAWGQPVGGAQSYSLAPVFQFQYNALAAPINAARKQALQAAKGGLSARGLGKSGAHALEQQINAYADQDLSSALNQIMQAQQAQKL